MEKKKSGGKKEHPLLTKILLRITTIISLASIAALVLIIFSSRVKSLLLNPEKEVHEAMVTQQLLSVKELIVQKYRYSDIITMKKSLVFSKSYSIVKISGIIRAGISDVSKIEFKISDDGKSISLKIPAAEILGNDITEQSVFDEHLSIFVPITTQEIFDEIDHVRTAIEDEAVGDGLLKEADNDARKSIMQMMYALGFEKVLIEN